MTEAKKTRLPPKTEDKVVEVSLKHVIVAFTTIIFSSVLVGSTVNFIRMFGIMPESEILTGYLERCVSRPAYQRALAREEPASA